MVDAPNPLEAAFDAPAIDDFVDIEDVVNPEPLTDDVAGLLQLGNLGDVVKVGNHEIRIRTLKIGEELSAALIANRYKDTVEEARALATALVAAAIVSVDGEPLLGQTLGPRGHSHEAKFDYLLENWYWETINQVWIAYNKLLERVREATVDLKKD